MARIIYIKDGGLNTSTTIPPGYTALGSDIGELKKKVVDTISGVIPYKVYTALLTQSGGSSELYLSYGSLVIGTTYLIGDGDGGDDFTNVGAPNSNNGTSFVATGTTPANWTHNAILYYNTGAPVTTVLENTIGNIWFTYESPGVYAINTNSLIFLFENTFAPTITVSDGGTPILYFFGANLPSDGKLFIYGDEGYLYNTPIEIRVYN